jgi:hypothetical protein
LRGFILADNFRRDKISAADIASVPRSEPRGVLAALGCVVPIFVGALTWRLTIILQRGRAWSRHTSFCHPEQSEGPMYSNFAMHRSFAPLGMTIPDLYGESNATPPYSGFSTSRTFSAPSTSRNWTSIISRCVVCTFRPTKVASTGNSRCPRSISTQSWTRFGRP